MLSPGVETSSPPKAASLAPRRWRRDGPLLKVHLIPLQKQLVVPALPNGNRSIRLHVEHLAPPHEAVEPGLLRLWKVCRRRRDAPRRRHLEHGRRQRRTIILMRICGCTHPTTRRRRRPLSPVSSTASGRPRAGPVRDAKPSKLVLIRSGNIQLQRWRMRVRDRTQIPCRRLPLRLPHHPPVTTRRPTPGRHRHPTTTPHHTPPPTHVVALPTISPTPHNCNATCTIRFIFTLPASCT